MEDDWRVGKIASYLERLSAGSKVCAIQIYKDCLYPESSNGPKNYESREIGQIISKIPEWERGKDRAYFDKYGQQRYWVKTKSSLVSAESELPF